MGQSVQTHLSSARARARATQGEGVHRAQISAHPKILGHELSGSQGRRSTPRETERLAEAVAQIRKARFLPVSWSTKKAVLSAGPLAKVCWGWGFRLPQQREIQKVQSAVIRSLQEPVAGSKWLRHLLRGRSTSQYSPCTAGLFHQPLHSRPSTLPRRFPDPPQLRLVQAALWSAQQACVGMLFWSFLLMSFVQCMAGIIVSELCYGFISDPQNDRAARDLVFTYYGTFTRTILSMFEIMFANWAPACRVLVDNVSEWFSVFFLVYRCVMGFAVLNVVSAVFVQQAMKTASSDEELAFRQKEREVQAYNRKVLKLFQSIDHSGDGAISLEEFEKLVQSPKLKFWMSQLELEYHDLLSLFEFLDNGDGQITLVEFIEGAQRLRGGAKALDIWRMETKIEVLFEEVLKSLTRPSADLVVEASAPLSSPADTPETTDERPSRSPSKERIETVNVHQVFQKSAFKHIRATTSRHFDAEECG